MLFDLLQVSGNDMLKTLGTKIILEYYWDILLIAYNSHQQMQNHSLCLCISKFVGILTSYSEQNVPIWEQNFEGVLTLI